MSKTQKGDLLCLLRLYSQLYDFLICSRIFIAFVGGSKTNAQQSKSEKGGASYMKEKNFSYSTRIGKTNFIVNVKQSESAKKPLDTVFKEICMHEVLSDFSADKSSNLEKLQKSS